MLSKSAINAFDLSMRLSIKIKSSPFIWNKERLKLQVDGSRMSRTLFASSMLFVIVHASFVTLRTFKGLVVDGISPVTFMLQLTLVFQCFLALVMQLNTFFRRDEMAEFMTMLFKIEQRLSDKYQTRKVKDTCGPFLWALSAFNFVQIFGVAFLYLTHPKIQVFYFSMTDLSSIWKYVFMPLEVLPYAICWLNALPYSGTAIMFVASTSFWLQEMQLKSTTSLTPTSPTLRSIPNVLLVYRNLQLMTNRFNVMVNFSAMQGHKILNLLLTIGSLYGTIAFYDRLPFQAYITFPTVTCACFTFARMVYPYGRILNESADELRKSWGMGSVDMYSETHDTEYLDHDLELITIDSSDSDNADSIRGIESSRYFVPTSQRILEAKILKMAELKYLLKHLQSCRDLKVQMGNYYYFEKTTAVTFMYTAVEYAIMLIMSVDEQGFH